jgi:AmmeMemoRadiSam system protein A
VDDTDEITPQSLARDAVETYVRTGNVIPPPEVLPEALRAHSGAFVCLKRQGDLRGCIGTILPTADTVAEEIIRNAVRSAISDPRFVAVRPEELAEIHYSVDVLSEPEEVSGPDDLDVKRYGCIVSAADGRRGLLLPDLDGVDTVQDQVSICRQKGGIGPDEPVRLERFTVTRYGE